MHRDIDPHSTAHPICAIALDERGGRTYAKVELDWGGSHLAGLGVAYRHPADYLRSETGQELATARALSDLAEQLLVRTSESKVARRSRPPRGPARRDAPTPSTPS